MTAGRVQLAVLRLLLGKPLEIVALRLALIDSRQTDCERWLIERHGHRSPARFRRD